MDSRLSGDMYNLLSHKAPVVNAGSGDWAIAAMHRAAETGEAITNGIVRDYVTECAFELEYDARCSVMCIRRTLSLELCLAR